MLECTLLLFTPYSIFIRVTNHYKSTINSTSSIPHKFPLILDLDIFKQRDKDVVQCCMIRRTSVDVLECTRKTRVIKGVDSPHGIDIAIGDAHLKGVLLISSPYDS